MLRYLPIVMLVILLAAPFALERPGDRPQRRKATRAQRRDDGGGHAYC